MSTPPKIHKLQCKDLILTLFLFLPVWIWKKRIMWNFTFLSQPGKMWKKNIPMSGNIKYDKENSVFGYFLETTAYISLVKMAFAEY